VKRTQICLDDGQGAELGRRRRPRGVTKSALIRRVVYGYLNGGDEEVQLARLRAAVGAVAGAAPDLPEGSLYVERLRASDVRTQDELERQRGA
jgi:hypothetical protein